MKKLLKRFMLMAVLVLMFGLLGCGSTLTTNLTISDNFSGTRTMDVSISKADFEEYVSNGNFEVIAEDTIENTPECMAFSYEETEGESYVFHFTMSFTSKEDYESQIKSILGDGHTVEFAYSKAPFAKGVTLKESFSSADLLQWFKDYLVADNYVKQDEAAYVFEYTDNLVTINGNEYDCYKNNLEVSQKTYVAIKQMNFFTDIDAANGKIARKIELVFDSNIIESHREEVETYLAEVTPDGCVGEWRATENSEEIYTLVTPACTPDEMTMVMQTFCASEESYVGLVVAGEQIGTGKVSEEEKEEEEEVSISFSDVWDNEFLGDISSTNQVDSKIFVQPFGYESTINENLDLSNFVCDSWGEIDSLYYISVKNGKPESMIYTPDGEEIYGWDYIDSTYPDYYYVESQWRPRYQIVSTVNKYYLPTATEINTVVKSADKITREFVFKFSEPFDEMVTENIEKKMDSLFANYEDVLSVKLKNSKKDAKIIWKFKGTVDEVNALCDEIFGMGYSDISYYCQDSFVLKQQYMYMESIDLGSIFNWEYNGNIDYSLKTPGNIDTETSSVTGGVGTNPDINGKTVNYLVTESGYVNARVNGIRTNGGMSALIVVGVVFLLALAVGSVFVVLKLTKRKQKES